METKQCLGCGFLSSTHPWVVVMKPDDKDTTLPEGVETSLPGPNGFVAVPVCNDCHKDPAHRVRPIKGHFFAANDAPVGVYHAGSNAVGAI